MSKQRHLNSAKKKKNDEFYTQYKDIKEEIDVYYNYNNDVFKDKVVLLPCDDPEKSNFTKYFLDNFKKFGLREVISSCYSRDSSKRGKYISITSDNYKTVNLSTDWDYLQGDGDFRSDEVTTFRDESDFVITNPPFSLLKSFYKWLKEGQTKFSFIGLNIGVTMVLLVPDIVSGVLDYFKTQSLSFDTPSGTKKDITVHWYNSVPHGRKHPPLELHSMEYNLKHNKRLSNNPRAYKKYDNFDALEVPLSRCIPNDYTEIREVTPPKIKELESDGFVFEVIEDNIEDNGKLTIEVLNPLLGVPVSFVSFHNREQFELLGTDDYFLSGNLKITPTDGIASDVFKRYIIRRKL